MKEIANTLQVVQAREDEMRKMFEIVNTVDNCPAAIVSYSKRRYVAEFSCVDVFGNLAGFGLVGNSGAGGSTDSSSSGTWPGLSSLVTPGPGPRRIFLFSDTILVAAYRNMPKVRQGAVAPGNGKKMELVQKLDLNKVAVVEEPLDTEDAELILRLRPVVAGSASSEDQLFAFRMDDAKARVLVEQVAKGIVPDVRV
ncbi:hypothetical protein HK405_012232 [Cladochytrium tenue]|nr:hypothetical protein HK405_012232 [Cladochytrium tenue]